MSISNIEYYRKRIEEESRRAASETDPSVRHVHRSLVKMYRNRLQAEELRAELLPSSAAQRPNTGVDLARRDTYTPSTSRVPTASA
ncbi:hypothetical protein [Novosphingobium sp. Gsoil 351]|uniref:hypothetical protein n=1 Tax=Novosphingobium sp. Gsoil 351 TaxID=2675225 RepID=UPI0012B4ED39|nr:hypothetical protein [Novosphingobium sp. Gsoil 351]QGN55471.1 hypothetical protein GKE62_13850 [Novosphingobium sp. Gsoil 351]